MLEAMSFLYDWLRFSRSLMEGFMIDIIWVCVKIGGLIKWRFVCSFKPLVPQVS